MPKIGRPPRPIAARFWEKVQRGIGPDDCWIFTSKHGGLDYGMLSVKKGNEYLAQLMTPNEYQELAMRTMADQERISERVFELRYSGPSTQLQTAIIGLCADVGEFASCLQRWLEYGKELDRTNAVEELGDCLWRIAQACDALSVTMENVMRANIAKLAKRYPEKYSDERAGEERRNRAAEYEAVERFARERSEALDKVIAEVAAVEAARVPVSFGDGLARPDRASYGRICGVCNRVKIHQNNSLGVCPQCAADKRVSEVEEVESEEGEY